ncbi:neprilysin-3-like [Haemaphysalis longicornis]
MADASKKKRRTSSTSSKSSTLKPLSKTKAKISKGKSASYLGQERIPSASSVDKGTLKQNAKTICLLVVAVLFVGAGWMLFTRWVRNKPTIGFCDKPDCVRHAQELLAAMDSSASPCDNFYKFTCGSWRPKRMESSMIGRIYDESAEIAISEMESKADAVLPVAAEFYQTCADKRAQKESELAIFNSLKEDMGATNEVLIRLENFAKHMKTRTADTWKKLLNGFHKPDYSWNPESFVFVEDTRILLQFDSLLKEYQTREESLLEGFSWVYIQSMLWSVVGNHELLPPDGNTDLMEKFKKSCLDNVQSFFGLVVSARHLYARYNDTVRKKLDTFYESVRGQAVTDVKAAGWIQDSIKEKVITKIQDMGFNAMPEESFFSKIALANLYRDFSTTSGSFMRNYISVARAYRQVIGHESFVSVYSKRLGGGAPSRYNYYYNIAFMSLGALEPPLFYLDGTLAIRYGAVGTLIAECMVRSFDKQGILVNDRGEQEPWWGSTADYDKVVNCDMFRGTGKSGSDRDKAALFPLAPALSASFRAYRAAIQKIKGDPDQLRLKGLEDYSDDQVFFMTYCLMRCNTGGKEHMCNIPVRNTKMFATVFQCPPDSPMNPNPKNKCTVLD